MDGRRARGLGAAPLGLALAAAVAVVGGGCGAKASGPRDGGTISVGDAGTAPAGAWTWIDIPGAVCDDGTPTGIAVNPAPGAGPGGDLMFFFMGGGACWDASTCFLLNLAVHGPYGKPQWEAMGEPTVAHALDRARATNPFRSASYVFVPYCTGDLHAGSNVATYDVLGPRPYHHVGRLNVEAMLPLVHAAWPAAGRVIVSGSSAGGFGATLNYDLVRRAYPAAEVALVDDSGPLLKGSDIPPDQRGSWNASWHLGEVIDPLCAGCKDDLSLLYPALTALYPRDRMALLSSLQDQVIRTYFLILLGPDFELKLRAMIADRLDPAPAFHAFLIPGESHVLLGNTDTLTSGGRTLESWLTAMLSGDATWATVGL